MNQTTELLGKSVLGAELTEPETESLAALMHSHKLSDGEYLMTEGTTDNALHVVLHGKLEVVRKVSGHREVSLAILRPGELAGELGFIDGETHSVGLRALCDTSVVSLERDDFEGIVADHPQLVYKVMRAVVRSTHNVVRRMNHQFVEMNNYIFAQHGRY